MSLPTTRSEAFGSALLCKDETMGLVVPLNLRASERVGAAPGAGSGFDHLPLQVGK